MPKLDPKDKSKGGPPVVAPSDYVLGISWFQRKQSKRTGADYISFRMQIVDDDARTENGKLKHKGSFFTTFMCDLSKDGTVRRWMQLAEALGIEDQFEIGDSSEGTANQGDRDIERLFLGRAFVGRVKKEDGQQGPKNELAYVVFREKWNALHGVLCETWREEWLERQAAGGSSSTGAPPEDGWGDAVPSDEDLPPIRGGGSGYDTSTHSFQAPAASAVPDDDDIPF